jgi:hypothetical protein
VNRDPVLAVTSAACGAFCVVAGSIGASSAAGLERVLALVVVVLGVLMLAMAIAACPRRRK